MFEEDTQEYRVVVNDEEQYSIWPCDRELPNGWTDVGVSGGRQQCLDHIAEVWTDMRPLSVRRRTAGQPDAVPVSEPREELPSLVSRLSARSHPVELLLRDGEDLVAILTRGHLRLYFPTTQGGTEVTVPVDRDASDLSAAQCAPASGTLRVVGEFMLDYERVRCEAVIGLPALTGHGRLQPVAEQVASA